MTALVFPGQGTQRVGMGQVLQRGFPRAVDPVLAEAAAERPDLPVLLRRGPPELLARTENAQLAVTAVNLCALAVLRAHEIEYDVVAGHSVGLLSALVAADSLDAPAALRLAAVRGALLGRLPDGGAMVSVVGIEPELAEAIVLEAGAETGLPVVVALVNGPATVVISGAEAAVERSVARARRYDVQARRLPVSHAFHSPLMLPALAEWRRVVGEQDLRPAAVPVVAETTGEPVASAADLRRLLIGQLTVPVRWDRVCEQLQVMGEWRCVETGDSKTLRALCRPYPKLWVASMAVPETLLHLRRHGRLPDPPSAVDALAPAGAGGRGSDG